jgi:DNA-binding CsgD family transcriptional regulator
MGKTVSDKLNKVLELVEFINSEIPDGNALCQFVTLRTFNDLGAINMFISELKPGGLIIPSYQFGFSHEEMESWNISSVDEHIPAADALKNNSFVWLSDNEDWDRDYPDLANYKIPAAQTFICWPIHIRGAYMTVLGVTFKNVVLQNDETRNFLETISGLIGLQISSLRRTRLSVEQDSSVWKLLNNRQHKIVSMMSEGMTNSQIAAELGYSESTIRQDTIKIYEILGVPGRKGATQAFRVNYPIHGNGQLVP